MKYYQFLTNNVYTLVFVYISITVFNIATWDSTVGLYLSLLQYLVVGVYVARDIRLAFFLHIIFTISCVNGGLVAIEHSFSYAKLKLVGPITLNYVVLGIMWLLTKGETIKVHQQSLLLSFRKLVLAFIIIGSAIGVLGILIDNNYSIKYFINYLLYIVVAFLYIDIYIKIYNDQISKILAVSTICMMAAATISSFISFEILGVKASYSVDETFIYTPIFNLAPCLFIAIFQLSDFKLKIVSLAGFLFYLICATVMSRGTTFVTSFVVIVLYLYLVYFKKNAGSKVSWLRLGIPGLLIFILPVMIDFVLSEEDVVSQNKFDQFTSIFSILDFSQGFDQRLAMIGRSPYIRMAEILDIVNDGFDNVITLFIGSGYGAYYTDSLHLFTYVDLSNGAFPYEMIKTGFFYKAHNAISCTILFNGLIGLFFIIKLSLSYLKKIDKTFLVFASFSLFLYGFYFDIVALVSYSMALFGAEYMISGESVEKSLCKSSGNG